MKKNYLLMAGFASLMAFSACSNDDDLAVPSTPVIENDGTVFEIAISNTGEGTTKATRPMGSSRAANDVNVIKLAVFTSEDQGTTWTKQILSSAPTVDGKINLDPIDKDAVGRQFGMALLEGDGLADSYDLSTGAVDLFDQNAPDLVTIKYSDKLEESPNTQDPTASHISRRARIKVFGLDEDKWYRVVAYGYNEDVANTANQLKFTDKNDGSTLFTATQTLNTNTGEEGTVYDLEEVFATSATSSTITREVTVGDDDVEVVEFSNPLNLTLTRQVAGILVYLDQVPCRIVSQFSGIEETVEKIEVVANRKAAYTFTLPNKMLDNEDFNGNPVEEKEDVLMTFTMGKTFGTSTVAANYTQKTSADTYTFTSTNGGAFADDYELPAGTFKTDENSLFGARYLMPYDGHYTALKQQVDGQNEESSFESTLEIRLYTLKNDANFDNTTPSNNQWELIAIKPVRSNTAGDYSWYDIRCNNFYSIGTKLTNGNINNDDDPESLTADIMTLQVNDAWSVLHDMVVD